MEQNLFFGKKWTDLLVLLLFGVVLLFGGMFIPLLGTVAVFLWCLPVVFAVYRYGIGSGLFLGVLFVLLGVAAVGVPAAMFSVGCMSVLGLVYGIAFRKKYAPGKILVLGTVLVVAFGALNFFLTYTLEGVSLGEMRRGFEAELAAVYNVYVESGNLDTILIEGMGAEAYFAELIKEIMQMLPSFFFLAALVIAAANYLIAQFVLKKQSADIRSLPPFTEWHLPWWVLWGVVAALIFYVGGNFFDSEILLATAKNILICSAPVFLVAGISLVRYFFVKWNVSAGIQVGFWIFVFLFFSVAMMFFVLMGAGDAAVDYRANVMKKKNNDVGGHEK
ncbi:MAG: DUF2232 domain-containing protein [Firmicutes bacterium]|nr:DUF2232 domain-containing protein [Bacillota bacterium]